MAAAISGAVAISSGCIVLALALLLREMTSVRILLRQTITSSDPYNQGGERAAPPMPAAESAYGLPSQPDAAPEGAGLHSGATIAGAGAAGALAAVAAAMAAQSAPTEVSDMASTSKENASKDGIKDSMTTDTYADLSTEVAATAIIPEAPHKFEPAAKEPDFAGVIEAELATVRTLPKITDPLDMTANGKGVLTSAPDQMPEPAPYGDDKASVVDMAAQPPAAVKNLDMPLPAQDPFDLQSEIDRMFDESSTAKPAVETPQSDEQGSVLGSEDQSQITADDKRELESLLRSAIADDDERETLIEAGEEDEEDADRLPPILPTLEDMRASIAPANVMLSQDSEPAIDASADGDRDKAWQGEAIDSPAIADMPAMETSDENNEHLPEQVIETAKDALADQHASVTESPQISELPPERSIIRTFSSGPNQYTMYSDGSISADTPSGRFEFSSFNELREFIDTYKV
ncbi:MAG: hypothetical protein ACRCTD_04510 [Beijerinckiaceae bacterium]